MSIRTSHSQALSTVPPRKIAEALNQTLKDCTACTEKQAKLDGACLRCRTFNAAIQRYADANIPVMYWKLEMVDFRGDAILLEKYNEIIGNLKQSYENGVSLCFAGSNGLGKTYTATNILKTAINKGYSGLYATLNDIVACTINNPSDEKAAARKELITVDFLVIDEFDPRHMGSENAADLFGRILEDIFRNRSQNKMPTFMCTNSPNVVESFTGPIKQSIGSLMNYVQKVSVLGKDFRKTLK